MSNFLGSAASRAGTNVVFDVDVKGRPPEISFREVYSLANTKVTGGRRVVANVENSGATRRRNVDPVRKK